MRKCPNSENFDLRYLIKIKHMFKSIFPLNNKIKIYYNYWIWTGRGKRNRNRLLFGVWIPVRRDYPRSPDRPWGLPSLLYNGCRLGTAAAAWRWPNTLFRTEVKERVELQSYSPYRPLYRSWGKFYLTLLSKIDTVIF